MLSFTGIGQVQGYIRGSDRTYGNKTSRKYEVLVSTSSAGVAYDGKNPFDNYPITVECPITKPELYNLLQPGAVIWIQNGKILTTVSKGVNGMWWNVHLTTTISDIVVMYHTPLGPSYEEHLRVYNNRKINRNTI